MTKEEIVEEIAEGIFQYSNSIEEIVGNTNTFLWEIKNEVRELVVEKVKSRSIQMDESLCENFTPTEYLEWQLGIKRFRNPDGAPAMNEQLRDLALQIKDLEAEFDYYNLYEPDERESADRLKRLIDKTYDEYDDLKKRIDNEKLDAVKESSFSK